MRAPQYFFPAEWEPHEATWLAWPHNRRDWPGKMAAIPWVFAEMVRRLLEGERVRIVVQDARQEASAGRVLEKAGANCAHVEFFRIPTDRDWARDSGPIFVRRGSRSGELAIADFRFNGWGGRYQDFRLDDRLAARAARILGVRTFCPMAGGKRFALEGGAIEVNGRGTLLSTEPCMLNAGPQVRNPHLAKGDIEEVLRTTLGANNVFYLGEGIAGDDTGGHIDDFCRFVGPRTVAVVTETNPKDENFVPLADARERLKDLRLEDGSRPEVVALPSPGALVYGGCRLPASYANFYIANAVVLVPTFNDPADRTALGILSELLPGRKVVGIHAVDLVLGHGAVHCLTQQQPAA